MTEQEAIEIARKYAEEHHLCLRNVEMRGEFVPANSPLAYKSGGDDFWDVVFTLLNFEGFDPNYYVISVNARTWQPSRP